MSLYPWLHKLYEKIISYYIYNKNYAFLLENRYENGAKYLVHNIICWLLCPNKKNYKFCKKCISCNLMQLNNHPDVYKIILEKNKKSIGIDSIRIIIKNIYNYSIYSKSKIIYIHNFELITKKACNSLLKVIEEPPKNTFFIFVCKYIYNVLPTIKSRCIFLKLDIPIEESSVRWISNEVKKFNIKSIYTALNICNGSILNSVNLLKSNLWNDRINVCKIFKKSLIKNNMLLLVSIAGKKNNVEETLNIIYTLLTDGLKYKNNITNFFTNLDQEDLYISISKYFSSHMLIIKISQCLYCIKKCRNIKYINNQLLLIDYLLNFNLNK
ncbi:MAG: DNA polymerase III subunit delta' C-terminal domain-containing protein [Enterobacterales bacterium]